MRTNSSHKIDVPKFSFPFGKTYDPSFYFEESLACLLDSVKEKNQIDDIDAKKILDLFLILIGRPDQLKKEETTTFLETIIENFVNKDKQSAKKYFRDRQDFTQNIIFRIDELNDKFEVISYYRKNEFTEKEYLNIPKLPQFDQPIGFLKILNAIGYSFKNSLDQQQTNEITRTTAFLNLIFPFRIINPPNYDHFLPKNVDFQLFDFNDYQLTTKFVKYLGCNSLTTNGQYIFLLTSHHFLFAFPIMNNGTLMPPKMVRLPFKEKNKRKRDDEIEKEEMFELSQYSCITAYPTFIEIHPYTVSNKSFLINIDQIASQSNTSSQTKSDNQSKLFSEMKLNFSDLKLVDSPLYLYKISNGVVSVIVSKYSENSKIGFKCEIYDIKTQKLIQNVQLNNNDNNKCDETLPTIFPDVNYNEVPIETNGTTISFIFEDYSIYRTFSLITGQFISDEKVSLIGPNNSKYHIIASTIDSLNNCRWVLTSTPDNKVCLQKMKYFSSVDPYIFHIKEIQSNQKRSEFLLLLNNILKHLCCSPYPPSFLLGGVYQEFSFFDDLLRKLSDAISKKDCFMTQTLCLLLSLNAMNNETLKLEAFKEKLFKIVLDPNLEIGLRFLLFFPGFKNLINQNTNRKETIDIIKNLFLQASEQKNDISNDFLISYALRILENCDEFSSYPLLETTKTSSKLFENDQILSLYIVHQRAVIRNYATNMDDTKKNPVKNYFSDISDRFLTLIPMNSNKKDLDAFATNPMLKLFHNFIHLLTPLTKNHKISLFACPLLTAILNSYVRVQAESDIIKLSIYEVCYTYGLFLSTLISGGELTPFENDFIWAIRSNYDLLGNKTKLIDFDSESDEDNNDFSLDVLYKNIKPKFNENLSEDIIHLDKCVIAAIAQHMNCFDELVNLSSNSQISDKLRQSFIETQRVRNQYRRYIQSNKVEKSKQIISKSFILRKLKSTSLIEKKASIFADFILSPFSPKYIKDVFLMQKNRISTTENGFPLLNDVFRKDENQYLKIIIGHILKKHLNFEGLNSIICMADKTILNANDVNMFFNNIYPITDSYVENEPSTRIIPYRFFKSIKRFPEILEQFLMKVLNTFILSSNDLGLYALVVSLIRLSDKLPESKEFQSIFAGLAKLPINAYELSLIENIILKASDDFVYTDEFINLIFNDSLLSSPAITKIAMRIRYHFLTTKFDKKYEKYLNAYLEFIGNHLYDDANYFSFLSAEYITLLRKIYLYALSNENSLLKESSFITSMIDSIDEKTTKEDQLLGLFAVCGFTMETPNPYSIVEICSNEDIMNTYLLIPDVIDSDENLSNFNISTCKCYDFPFDISSEPHRYSSIPKNSLKTVVHEFSIQNDFLSNKIKDLLMSKEILSNRYATFPIRAQALLSFYSHNQNFLTKENQDFIDSMCSMITPFNDIFDTYSRIQKFKSYSFITNNNNKFKVLEELNDQFGVIQSITSVSYLTQQIQKDCPEFELVLEVKDEDDILSKTKNDLFHFGIISDSLEEEQTRLSSIGFPSGIIFPENKKVCDIELNKDESTNAYKFVFTINPKTKKFSLQSNDVDFPIGRKFRIIIFKKVKTTLVFNPIIENAQTIFNQDELPDLEKIISTKRKTNTNEYEDFNFINYSGNSESSQEIDLNQKLRLTTHYHPMNPVLHLNNAQKASSSIIDHHLKGLYVKLGRQWITVLLMKIAIKNPSLISKYAFELFSLLSIPLETFDQIEFNQNHFPFSLERPPWKSTTMVTSLEQKITPGYYILVKNDMMNALNSIIKNSDCLDSIAAGIYTMSSSNNLHQIALPQKYHTFKYFSKESNSNVINLNTYSIIAFNDYEGVHKNAAFITENDNKVYYDLPFVFTSPVIGSMTQMSFESNDKPLQVSILEVNSKYTSLKNEWIIDTPIELLVHLKNFAFATESDQHLSLIKTILLDLYLGKSPFTIPYIHQFQNFAQMKCANSLLYKDELYMKHLIALDNYLKSTPNPDEYYVNLFESEQPMISNKFRIEDAGFFPEFFTDKVKYPKPTTDSITIPIESINPGMIQNGFQSRILNIKNFFQERKSLVGFQFWEVLPYWDRFIEIFGYDKDPIKTNDTKNIFRNENNDNEIILTMKPEIVTNEVYKIVNPYSKAFNVRLIFKRKLTESELQTIEFKYSIFSSFRRSIIIKPEEFDKPIKISRGDTYFSMNIKSVPQPWLDLCTLKIESISTEKATNEEPKTKTVKVTEEYRSQFVQSMKSSIFDWKQEHTEQLLSLFSIEQLMAPTFDTISKIALESNLCQIFPRSVVLLKALFLHQFNFIRLNENKTQVSEFLWNSCANLIPILEKCTELSNAIARKKSYNIPMTINRKVADSLIERYNNISAEIYNNQSSDTLIAFTDRENSIISQFARFIKTKNIDMDHLKSTTPFRLNFTSELGRDALDSNNNINTTGLFKELLNDSADSFFQPSTQLFMKTKCNDEYFIPETRKRRAPIQDDVLSYEYFTIGIIIGMISRNNSPQYLPFAPFIWKFIAGEEITPDDIAEVDDDLKCHFKAIRNKEIELDWTVTTWIGSTTVLLQNPTANVNKEEEGEEDYDNEINRYLIEYTKFRLSLIAPMLQKIREGFIANTELGSNSFLSGKVLSFMAQGTVEVTLEMLKDITRVVDLGLTRFSKFVDMFWTIVSEFNAEQRVALLKFVTGATRIPKMKVDGSSFTMAIAYKLPIRENGETADDLFPTSQTCFNKLYWPMYTDINIARRKLVFSIQNCATLDGY